MRKVLACRVEGIVHDKELNCKGSFGLPDWCFGEGDEAIRENEQIDIVNLRTGRKWTTYAYKNGDKFKASGGAANYFEIGDKVLILAWQYV